MRRLAVLLTLGGAVACTFYLDFTFVQFFERLRDTVGPWHFYTGMIKAPVFGAVIATIGCFEGLQVHGSALLTRWLLENELVDEVNLLTCPVVVGQGMRLFPDAGPDIALDLVDSRAFPEGITLQVYRPAGRPQYAT